MKENVTAYLNFRFEKIRLIKKNAKSEVWLAVNKSTNQPVIMKMINAAGLPYATLKENFHPLMTKIFYCAESETDTVIVEEFISGETLDGKNLTETDAKKLLIQICDGLKFLHGLGIIHRDIKPSNLILQSNGIIRLIDFDAARVFKENQSADTKLIGTKGYAPPEQYGFGQTDSRSDIYSLGKTFLELTNCGGSLKKILQKCVEVDQKNRYQSADELKAALTKKNFSPLKICASILATVAGIFFAYNSTADKNIPAEIETLQSENNSSPVSENVPTENETPANKNILPENNLPSVSEDVPAENETPANKNILSENNLPPVSENISPKNETVPENKKRAEILTPLPQNSTLENFQPSFPTIQQYNFELRTDNQNLGGVHLGDSLETVKKILGDAEEIKSYDGLNFVNHFYKNLNVTIENNVATCITTKNADIATLKFIRQGDTLEKVLAAYGNHYQTRKFGNVEVYIFPYDLIHSVNESFSAELRFTVENNIVTAITLMTVEN